MDPEAFADFFDRSMWVVALAAKSAL
jgi:hypothetical protein